VSQRRLLPRSAGRWTAIRFVATSLTAGLLIATSLSGCGLRHRVAEHRIDTRTSVPADQAGGSGPDPATVTSVEQAVNQVDTYLDFVDADLARD
jgi:hypothetical protein